MDCLPRPLSLIAPLGRMRVPVNLCGDKLIGMLRPLHAGPNPGSRPLLLALGWLIAHCRVFQRAARSFAIAADLAAQLPPYHEDTWYAPAARKWHCMRPFWPCFSRLHCISPNERALQSYLGWPGSCRRTTKTRGTFPASANCSPHLSSATAVTVARLPGSCRLSAKTRGAHLAHLALTRVVLQLCPDHDPVSLCNHRDRIGPLVSCENKQNPRNTGTGRVQKPQQPRPRPRRAPSSRLC